MRREIALSEVEYAHVLQLDQIFIRFQARTGHDVPAIDKRDL